jgi:predicted nucleic acid-binding protein
VKLLLDTSILIDVLRGRKSRRELLGEWLQAGHTLATTTVNVAEVFAGIRPHEQMATEALLSGLECYELTLSAARLAGRFVSEWRQRGRTLELPDALVAAVAIERNCPLATDNRKDFPMPEVKLYPL